jgi:MFS family permease
VSARPGELITAPVHLSRRRLVVGGALVSVTPVVSHAFGRSTFGLLLPAIEETLGLTHAQSGLGGTVIFAAYLVGVIVVASLATRVDPVTIMRGGIAIAAAGLLWLSTVNSLEGLLLGLFLTGGAGAGIWITAPGILTASVGPRRRGLVIGLLTASTGLGTFLTGVGTARVRARLDDDLLWRPVFLVEAVATVALLVALVVVVGRAGRPGSGSASSSGTGSGSGSGEVGSSGVRRRRATLFDLDRLRTVPSWGRVTGAYALFGAVGAGFAPFLVRALQDDAGLSSARASAVFAAMGLVAIPGAPLMGMLSDRYGRKPLLVGVLAGAGVGTTTVALGAGLTAALGVFCFGAVWSSFPTLVATYVRDHTGAEGLTEAFSTMTIFYSMAALTAPFLVGWLADRTGHFRSPFLALSALCVAGTVLLLSVPAAGTAPERIDLAAGRAGADG